LGGLCLPAGKHTGILTDFQTKVKKKMAKNELFLDILPIYAVMFSRVFCGKFL